MPVNSPPAELYAIGFMKASPSDSIISPVDITSLKVPE